MTSSRTHSPLGYLRNAGIDAAYLTAGLPIGCVTFTVIVTGLSLGAGLAITLVGIPILLATLVVGRWFAVVERHRAALVLGEPIAAPERPLTGDLWKRSKALAMDAASWLDMLWSLLLLALGTAGFTVAVTAWSTALGLVTSPAWWWALPNDGPDVALLDSTAVGYSVLRVLIGLALIPVAYWVCRGFSVGTAQLARLLLGERQAPTQVLSDTPVAA